MRAPLATATIVLLVSVGIASVLTIFGPLYSLVLSPLPLADADRIVRLGGRLPLFNIYTSKLAAPEAVRPVLAGLAAFAPATEPNNEWRIPGDERLQKVIGSAVTPGFFETLNAVPRVGRTVTADGAGASGVVISERLWRARFGSAGDVVGQAVSVAGRKHVIVGVMPAGFDFPRGVDAWLPMADTPYLASNVEIIGRLSPGVSISQASQWLDTHRPPETFSGDGKIGSSGPTVQLLADYLRGDTRNTLLTILAASLALVLLSCVGVINLLLARSADRRAEIAIQFALGASRGRLVRQFFIEITVMVSAGAVAGLWLSSLGRQWLHSQLPDLSIEWPVTPITLAAIAGLIVLVTVLSGLAPAFYLTNPGRSSLVASASSTSSAPRRLSLIDVLATLQLALAVGLLTCTVLLGRSLYAQVNTPLGFAPENVLSFKTALARPAERLAAEAAFRSKHAEMGLRELARATFRATKPQIAAEYQRNRLFLRQLTDRVAAMPDVVAVGVLSPTPFSQEAISRAQAFANFVSSQSGADSEDQRQRVPAINGYVSEAGFDVLGVRFLAGRPFSATEIEEAFQAAVSRIGEANTPHPPYPAIVNEALARRVWGDVNPVGKYFNTNDAKQAFTVVGVVANFQWTPGVAIDRPAVYRPFDGAALTAEVIVRTRSEAAIAGVAKELDSAVTSLAADASHIQVQRLNEMVSAEQHVLRVVLTLVGCFAVVGMLVAALGIFAAANLLVRSSTRELGIRLALGASPAKIRLALLGRLAGTLAGFPAGWFLGWLLVSQLSRYLVNITANDVTGYVDSGVVAGIAVFAALVVPLSRAGRVDPVTVLRQ